MNGLKAIIKQIKLQKFKSQNKKVKDKRNSIIDKKRRKEDQLHTKQSTKIGSKLNIQHDS